MEYLEIIEKSMDQLVSLAHFMVSTIFKKKETSFKQSVDANRHC